MFKGVAILSDVMMFVDVVVETESRGWRCSSTLRAFLLLAYWSELTKGYRKETSAERESEIAKLNR